MFDVDFVRSLVDRHQAGTRNFSEVIWSLIMFDSFLRQVHGRPALENNRPERDLSTVTH